MQRPAIFGRYLASAIVGLCLLLTTGLVYAQTSQEQASSPSAIRGTLPGMLVKSIDSKKAKEGDVVVVQTAGAAHDISGRLIPSGTKVIGHVTQAQARSKGDAQSSLAIVFDKVELGKNEEVPIKGVLQAVGPSLPGQQLDTSAYPPGLSGKGGGGTTAAPISSSTSGPSGVHTLLTSESHGALGVKNLEMGDNGVLTSPGKEVKLDANTQMMIRAE